MPISFKYPTYASHPYTTAHFSNIYQEDNQVISWPGFVRRVGTSCNSNPLAGLSSSPPHPVPARALNGMRTISRIGSYNNKNFLIALFNKGPIDMRVSLHRGLPAEECNGRTLTRALEWNLQFSLMEYLVDRRGRVRKVFLKSKNRTALVDEVFRLGRRFIFMSILTIFASFILVYLLMYWFFRSFNVRLSLHMMWQFSLRRTGVLPGPVF